MGTPVDDKTKGQEATLLRRLLHSKGIANHAEFAKRHNIPGGKSMMHQHLVGSRPISLAAASAYAKALNCHIRDFSQRLDNAVKNATDKGLVLGVQSFQNTNNTAPGPGIRGKIPVISWVQAGEMMETVDLYAPGYADEWVDTTTPINRHTYALRVLGDSMEPDFPSGMLIVVEPELSPESHDFVIAKIGDSTTFKQLIKDGPDWYLKPLNSRYPVRTIDDSVRIIGVIREAIRRFR